MRVREGLRGCIGFFLEENEEYFSKRNFVLKEIGSLGGLVFVGRYKYFGSDNLKRV